jgi:hypothetical protein
VREACAEIGGKGGSCCCSTPEATRVARDVGYSEAELVEENRRMLQEAGLVEVELVSKTEHTEGTTPATFITSLDIPARKPV